MLQLTKMYRQIFQQISTEKPHLFKWNTLDELEDNINRIFSESEKIRQKRITGPKKIFKINELIDHRLWSNEIELLDQPNYPVDKKQKLVEALHKFNLLVHSYPRFLNELKPIINLINRKKKRKARILELASGSGRFSMELAKLVQKRNLLVEITGSDYIPEYVKRASLESKYLGIPVKFKLFDALNLHKIEPGEYDLIFTANSLHHFSPGAIARMIAGAVKVATWGFMGMDGYRSFLTAMIVAGMGFLASLAYFNSDYFHDSWLTSRKFYTHPQLELISKIATPGAKVNIEYLNPCYTKVHIYKK